MELRAICRDYAVGGETVHALDHIDLKIEAGEYISIMGPSGSGKSTLLNVLGLLDRPTSGSYHLEGEDVSRLEDDALALHRQQHIGFIFQFFHLIPTLTALENVMLPALIAGMGRSAAEAQAKDLLGFVGLGKRLSHRPSELSGGEQQRVAIARAVANAPRVLFADEPTGNLDPLISWEIMELLVQINQLGVTVLVATHDSDIVTTLRRRVIGLEGGRLIRDEEHATYHRVG